MRWAIIKCILGLVWLRENSLPELGKRDHETFIICWEMGKTIEFPPFPDSEDDDSFDEFELKYGASHVIKLFVPVSICMAMVVATMNSINFYSDSGGRHL